MPSFGAYQQIVGSKTVGEALKHQSDDIMNATWWNDINSTVGYLYDRYHDSEPTTLYGLSPEEDTNKMPIDVKVVKNASQTYEKDYVTTHLLLRPGQKCNVDYYEECFERRYNARFPVGLYIDIKDSDGVYNKWLIVEKANALNTRQFPTYEILPCDKVIQYIFNGIRYQIAGVLRSQNSYNSGKYTDYVITKPEDQQKLILPCNRDTEKIYYDQRMIIDTGVLTEPRAWSVSKVNRISPNGVIRLTFAQDKFDANRDYIELDEVGNVIGMWADFYNVTEQAEDKIEVITDLHSEIGYSGTSSKLKVGGSYKKLAVSFLKQDEIIEPIEGEWKFTIDGEDASDVIGVIQTDDSSVIKVKAPTDPLYIGKILTVTHVTDKTTAALKMEIIAL